MSVRITEWLLLKSLAEEVRDTTLSLARKQEAEEAVRASICGLVESLRSGDVLLQGSGVRAAYGVLGLQEHNLEQRGENWLQNYLDAALAGNFCIRLHCFCGSMPFKSGLVALASGKRPEVVFRVDRDTSLKIAAGLAGLDPPSFRLSAFTPTADPLARPSDYEWAVMTVAHLLWSKGDADFETEVKPMVAGTWAGHLVACVQAHYAAAQGAAERRTYPEPYEPWETEIKRERQQRHAEQRGRKRERDKEWWARQAKGSA